MGHLGREAEGMGVEAGVVDGHVIGVNLTLVVVI